MFFNVDRKSVFLINAGIYSFVATDYSVCMYIYPTCCTNSLKMLYHVDYDRIINVIMAQ